MEELTNLLLRQDHGEPVSPSGPGYAAIDVDGSLQYLFVEKPKCARGLPLRGGADAPLVGDVDQEVGDVLRSQLFRVTQTLVPDEGMDPTDVRLFSPTAQVTGTGGAPDLLEKLGLPQRGGWLVHGRRAGAMRPQNPRASAGAMA
jgi:hypothetical protein